MSYSARDIGKIPSSGFDWYIYLLEDGLSDEGRNQLATNFEKLGQAVGPDALVVRGYDPLSFKNEVQEAYSGVYEFLGPVLPPALLVSDTAPANLARARETAYVMVFQLTKLSQSHGSVAEFLSALINALRDPESMEALKTQDPSMVRRIWGWLSRYVNLQPGIFGCSMNVNKAIGDLIETGERAVR